jgi:hypothetical protein
MSDLTDRINHFIEKQKVHMTHEEAQRLGFEKPKQPKTPKTPKDPKDINAIKEPRNKINPASVVSTIGRELSPRGPYQSPQDIAQDVNQGIKAGKAFNRWISPKKQDED